MRDFQDTQACLGATSEGFTYYLEISNALKISPKGDFFYIGPASVWNEMLKTGTEVLTTLEGHFTSATRASVTLEVIRRQCGIFNLEIIACPS